MIEFTKMHGLGNDFVVIDALTQHVDLEPELVRYLGDRNFGIGFDQLLLVEEPSTDMADFKYRIFNNDGTEVEQCGNGARCFARFVVERRLTFKTHLVVETKKGLIELDIDQNGWVTVNMGQADFSPESVDFTPASAANEAGQFRLPDVDLDFTVVSMGNPHAVTVVQDILTDQVERLGPKLESHPAFASKVNVGFMKVIDPTHIQLRVYERGAGETQACGSGACAAVAAGVRMGLLAAGEPVRVRLYAGELLIQFAMGQPVLMQGPTERVFDGVFSAPSLRRQAGLS